MTPLPSRSSRVIQLGPRPLNAHEELKAQTSRFRDELTELLSETKSSETVLRRQYLIILKRCSDDKSQAKRDQRSLSRTDMMVKREPGEPWIEFPDRSESTDPYHGQDRTAAVVGRLCETVDLQLEIIYLENACFMHVDRSEDTGSDAYRLNEFARFRARHVEFTGNSEPRHALIPVVPSIMDSYLGVTGWLNDEWIHRGEAPALLPTRQILDRSSHWQWPDVKLAVYSWAFYKLIPDYWGRCDGPTEASLRSAVWDIYFHARDGLSPELRERYSTAQLFGE